MKSENIVIAPLITLFLIVNTAVYGQLTFPSKPPSSTYCPNLAPFPSEDAMILFRWSTASTMDKAGNVYNRIDPSFCSGFNLDPNTGRATNGTDAGEDINNGRVHRLNVTLPAFRWGVTDINAYTPQGLPKSIASVSNAFTCNLIDIGAQPDRTLGTLNVPAGMKGGSNITSARGNRDVFMLDSDPRSCFARSADAKGNIQREERLEVRVDTGNRVSECISGSTPSSQAEGANNSRTYQFNGNSFARVQ